mmetsp:Transcript_90658/g.261225  ORF Transcript_90658/g.261225 Transcript_90658/m.261225 type:complete len:447 (-) Transcript_90658:125-1465(-)
MDVPDDLVLARGRGRLPHLLIDVRRVLLQQLPGQGELLPHGAPEELRDALPDQGLALVRALRPEAVEVDAYHAPLVQVLRGVDMLAHATFRAPVGVLLRRLLVLRRGEQAEAVDGWGRAHRDLGHPRAVVRRRGRAPNAEERKQRKRDKAAGGVSEVSFAVAQKIAPKVKAKDADDDIFGGVGKFDPLEFAKKAKAQAAPAKESSAKKEAARKESGKQDAGKKPSYFADAGSDKYLQAPAGQLELDDVQVEDQDGEGDRPKVRAQLIDDSKLEFDPSPKWIGPRKGWVFKTGSQGLGYYREASAAQAASSSSSTAGKKRKRGAAAAGKSAEEGDAYGELFPDSALGYAVVDTGEGDSDEEGDSVKAKIERLKKLAGKSGDADSVSANRKEGGDSKKKKLNEAQQWQKIDNMIKKGKHSSLEELEARNVGKKQPPKPREIMSTPAYF